jgi:hypothetical protein
MQDLPYESKPLISMSFQRVVRRSLVLAAMACRGSIDRGAGDPEAEDSYSRILEWLTELTLWEEVEPFEEAILRAKLGTLDQNEVIRSTWCVEGLAILAWALHRLDLPLHDRQVDPYDVTDSVLSLNDAAEEIIATSRLRDRKELDACDELFYAIHVRLRDFIRHRESKNFNLWVEKSWLDTLKIDADYLIVDGDLAIDNRAISEANLEHVQECSYLTIERRRAIAWLVEGGANYSQTAVDT